MQRFYFVSISLLFLFLGCVSIGLDEESCGGYKYSAPNQICENNVLKNPCGDGYYDPLTEVCIDESASSSSVSSSSRSSSSVSSSSVSSSSIDWNYSSSSFKTVVIGSQTWMAENVKYEAPNIKCYDNEVANCETYGVLYDWETAKTICPSGWHLPSDAEWNTLRDFIGSNVVGTKLKADSELWISGKGTDDFGFNALPGGHHRERFEEIREVSLFWSATTGSQLGSAHVRYVKYSNSTLNLAGFYIDKGWANVRCLKD